ncbi:MAG: hypothetical protein WBJ21_09095 [Burkholderiaceae bacterium]
METELKVSATTTIKDLSEFFNTVEDSDRIRARKEGEVVVLYVRNRSLLTVLMEVFSEEQKKRVLESRVLASRTIQQVLQSRDGGDKLDAATRSIHQPLHDRSHDIRPAEFKQALQELDTTQSSIGILRDTVQSAWHASIDQLLTQQSMPEWKGIQTLQSVGMMSDADKATLKTIILPAPIVDGPKLFVLNADPTNQAATINPAGANSLLDEVGKEIEALLFFLRKQGAVKTSLIDYPRIRLLAQRWEAATHAGKVPAELPATQQNLAVFFSKMNKPDTNIDGIAYVRGNLTEQAADVFVMTAAMSQVDKNAFAMRPEKVFVSAIEQRQQASFDRQVTEFPLNPPLPGSSAKTVIAVHCPIKNDDAVPMQELNDLYKEIAWHLQRAMNTGPSTLSVLMPPLAMDDIHHFPKAKGLAIMARQVIEMRSSCPGLRFKILVPAGLSETEIHDALLAEQNKQRGKRT